MVLDITTILLGVGVGVAAVLYAAPKGYLGHPRKKESRAAVTPLESYTQATEQASIWTAEMPAAAEPAPSTAPPLYETVQPSPAPVTYGASSPSSFGAPSISKKPTRTYRRRTAPVRSTVGSRAPRSTKPKKR